MLCFRNDTTKVDEEDDEDGDHESNMSNWDTDNNSIISRGSMSKGPTYVYTITSAFNLFAICVSMK